MISLCIKITMAIPIQGCLFIAITITASTADMGNCPELCICYNIWMKCNGTFPTYIPKEVTAVELSEIESEVYVAGVFCDTSWNNVRSLSITCLVRCRQNFIFGNDIFRCLPNLESLKLAADQLNGLSEGTFLGLVKVSSLDLSRCHRVCTPALITALSNYTLLPLLSRLILKSFCIFQSPKEIRVDQAFVDILGARPIQKLDFSYSNIMFTRPNLNPICDTLTAIIFTYSRFDLRSHIDTTKMCKSLQTIDLTGAQLSVEFLPFSLNKTNDTESLDRYGQFFLHVQNIYVNKLLPKNNTYSLHNCYLLVTNNNIMNFELCGYSFINFDVEFKFKENNLQRIALADNNIENIGSNVFKNLILLKEIDLSNNKLSRSKNINITFHQLFRRNNRLEKLSLASNDLTYLPYETFKSNTMMTSLDLSGNKFKQITFDISFMLNLNLLDMRNNAIFALNSGSRNALNALYRIQQAAKVNKTFEVDLRGNNFSCECASLDFVEWFVYSPLIAKKDQSMCHVNGDSYAMSEMAIRAATEDCERPIRRRRKIILATVIPSVTLVFVICVTIGIVKQRRRTLRRKRFDDRVRLLQDDNVDFRFLVFLSFSSEDDQFVMEHVKTPLQVHLLLLLICSLTNYAMINSGSLIKIALIKHCPKTKQLLYSSEINVPFCISACN